MIHIENIAICKTLFTPFFLQTAFSQSTQKMLCLHTKKRKHISLTFTHFERIASHNRFDSLCGYCFLGTSVTASQYTTLALVPALLNRALDINMPYPLWFTINEEAEEHLIECVSYSGVCMLIFMFGDRAD